MPKSQEEGKMWQKQGGKKLPKNLWKMLNNHRNAPNKDCYQQILFFALKIWKFCVWIAFQVTLCLKALYLPINHGFGKWLGSSLHDPMVNQTQTGPEGDSSKWSTSP